MNNSPQENNTSENKKNPSDTKLFVILHIIIIPTSLLYLYFISSILGETCMLHKLTGLMCPFCGMTRAHLAALRLDFAAAFGYNALFPLALPMLITAIYYPFFAKKFGEWMKWPPIIMAALLTIYCIVRQIFGF